MKTLTSPVSTQAAASQSGWVELYDFYLSASIATPWGTTNIIRLCTLPNGFTFFAPNALPEPAGTQGSAQTYQYWPLKRDVVKGDTKTQDDKLKISASNVTSQFTALLALVNWYDTPVVIRKAPLFQTGLTTNDCAVLFTGLVDAMDMTATTLQFTCSSSLGALSLSLPSENMHAACRFRFGDDQCTQIKYLPNNYMAGTCGAGSSATNIKSSDFTQDSGASSGYGTDLVDALGNSAITASSSPSAPMIGIPMSSSNTNYGNWFFKTTQNSAPATGKVIFSGTSLPRLNLPLGQMVQGLPYDAEISPQSIRILSSPGVYAVFDGPSHSSDCLVTIYSPAGNLYVNQAVTVNTSTDRIGLTAHSLVAGAPVAFIGTTMPAPLVAGVVYYVVNTGTNDFQVAATVGGSAINITTTGTAVKMNNISIIGAYGVRVSYNKAGWAFSNSADWGNTVQGYWQIPDAQAGLKNAALKPYIQFDFGSAVAPCTWQLSSFNAVQPEQRVRLIAFFSSSDASTWNFESYFEMPNGGGQLFDVLIPTASSKRYWRICVRSRWAETLYYLMFSQVSAYTGSRNWWMNGQITFDGNVTAALKGKTVAVRSSFTGEIFTASLPVAPAAGDTFVIKRGCGRTFNACCARLNTENYGGFNDLELQNIISVFKA